MRLALAIGMIVVGLAGCKRLWSARSTDHLSELSRLNVRVAQLGSLMIVAIGIITIVIVITTA